MFELKLEVEKTPGGTSYLVIKNICNGVTITSAKISFETLEKELSRYREEKSHEVNKKSWRERIFG